LREHCKYDGHTPFVIMLEKVSEHLEGTDEKVNNLEWICYYEDVDQLRQLVTLPSLGPVISRDFRSRG